MTKKVEMSRWKRFAFSRWKKAKETKKRTFVKVTLFTLVALSTTSFSVWYFSGKIIESLIAGLLVEISDSTSLYFLERLWSHVKWGYS